MPIPTPGTTAPDLNLPLTSGTRYRLGEQRPDFATLLVFYRGKHCPLCREQLEGLNAKADQFVDRGVQFCAISADSAERAREAREDWPISDNIDVVYGLDEDAARQWGLYLSTAQFDHEPKLFSEPGLFLLNASNEVYASWIQTTPFARPKIDDILSAIDFIREEQYPPRGKAA